MDSREPFDAIASPTLPQAAQNFLGQIVDGLKVSPLFERKHACHLPATSEHGAGALLLSATAQEALIRENEQLRKRVVVLTRCTRTLCKIRASKGDGTFDALVAALEMSKISVPSNCSECNRVSTSTPVTQPNKAMPTRPPKSNKKDVLSDSTNDTRRFAKDIEYSAGSFDWSDEQFRGTQGSVPRQDNRGLNL